MPNIAGGMQQHGSMAFRLHISPHSKIPAFIAQQRTSTALAENPRIHIVLPYTQRVHGEIH